MKSIVVYESMFGATHQLAEAVGVGLREQGECAVVHASEVTDTQLEAADLVVVGGPTMGHTLSNEQSRKAAVEMVEHPKSGATPLHLDELANAPGLREWFDRIDRYDGKAAAAFDSRVDMPTLVTGHASHGIARRLKKHKFTVVVDPHSFLVDKEYKLLPDQVPAAQLWGRQLATHLPALH